MKTIASILTALILALVLAVTVSAQEAPTFSIEPTSGSGGTMVSYEGEGYTPGEDVSVVISADGQIVDDTQADEGGAISGSFEAPNRDTITGETGDDVPVFAIDAATGAESERATFTYVAEDDQQDMGAGAGEEQQEMVTKTFELTLNGDVRADQAFGVVYGTSDEPEEFNPIAFCGQAGGNLPPKEDCKGEGTVYTADVTLAKGTSIIFVFYRVTEGDPETYETFHQGTETLNTDMTNTAWFTFGGAGAGDDQQDDQQTGAGDDQQDKDIPDALPETGAGGVAGSFSGSGIVALLTLLGAVVCGVIRRR